MRLRTVILTAIVLVAGCRQQTKPPLPQPTAPAAAIATPDALG